MYYVDDPVGYAKAQDKSLSDALQFRYEEIKRYDLHVDPFDDKAVLGSDEKVVATFSDPRLASIFTLFMHWWPKIFHAKD